MGSNFLCGRSHGAAPCPHRHALSYDMAVRLILTWSNHVLKFIVQADNGPQRLAGALQQQNCNLVKTKLTPTISNSAVCNAVTNVNRNALNIAACISYCKVVNSYAYALT